MAVAASMAAQLTLTTMRDQIERSIAAYDRVCACDRWQCSPRQKRAFSFQSKWTLGLFSTRDYEENIKGAPLDDQTLAPL